MAQLHGLPHALAHTQPPSSPEHHFARRLFGSSRAFHGRPAKLQPKRSLPRVCAQAPRNIPGTSHPGWVGGDFGSTWQPKFAQAQVAGAPLQPKHSHTQFWGDEEVTTLLQPKTVLAEAGVGAPRSSRVVTRGKFQTFDRPLADSLEGEGKLDSQGGGQGGEESGEGGRPDDVLPADLDSAIRQAGVAAAAFCNAGGTRALVELLVPDMEVVAEDGSQQKVWDASRKFLEALKGEVSCENVKAIFPDAGAAALLKYKWGDDVPFAISSLNERRPVADEDDLVVLVSPDWQLLEKVQSIAGSLADEDGLTRPMIMWNPRLSSGDVGIGLNVRRMRDFFLGSFTTVYFMRPLGIGAIYRSYPSAWNLFLDDPDVQGRYVLYRQQGSKPNGDDIEEMYLAATGKVDEEGPTPSFLDQVASTVSSLQRFMNSLSK